MLTLLAVCIHGYHPYAEDGGIYLTGVKRLLNPNLYPYETGFVVAHTRFSIFASLIAGLAKTSPLSLMTLVLLLYVVSIWMTIFAGWQIARRCFREAEACYGAICLLAVSLTIPVAGTSLMLFDPYLSARSFSTPCTLFAIMYALDARQAYRLLDTKSCWRKVGLCCLALCAAALMHPLMAGYCAGCILLLACISSDSVKVRTFGVAAVCLLFLLSAAFLYLFAPVETHDYAQVAGTRTYWFLTNWRWYEQFGLLAPIAILAFFGVNRQSSLSESVFLARTGALAGITGVTAAVLFANKTAPSLMVARLQPLRIFHTVYLLMILAIGGWIGKRLLRRNVTLWVAAFSLIAVLMFGVQRHIFAASSHLELPWRTPANAWEQAFVWVKGNTPSSAVFALDANFITAPGEDSQNFRAIAERSALPDFSKDGGVAAIQPNLTMDWLSGDISQRALDSESDTERITKLRATGVGWVVLSDSAVTALHCDYANQSVKVCRLPWTSILRNDSQPAVREQLNTSSLP